MPELPEVESAKRLAESVCLGRTITTVVAADDTKVFCGSTQDEVHAALHGRKITGLQRKGKYFWFELTGPGPKLLVHFGMAGHMQVKDVKSARYVRIKESDDWPPRFVKLQLTLDDGAQLAVCDGRRFAKMRLQEDPPTDDPICRLGPDTFLELPSAEGFAELMGKHKRAVKAVLLDQAVMSGIGNWIADEVCYMSRLFPEQPCCELTAEESKSLHSAIKTVLAAAVEAGAEKDAFPKDWLFHYRWTGKTATKDHFGNDVEFITVGGRTTAYVPSLQKLPPGRTSTAAKAKAKKANKAADDEGKEGKAPAKKPRAKKAAKATEVSASDGSASDSEEEPEPAAAKPKRKPAAKKAAPAAKKAKVEGSEAKTAAEVMGAQQADEASGKAAGKSKPKAAARAKKPGPAAGEAEVVPWSAAEDAGNGAMDTAPAQGDADPAVPAPAEDAVPEPVFKAAGRKRKALPAERPVGERTQPRRGQKA